MKVADELPWRSVKRSSGVAEVLSCGAKVRLSVHAWPGVSTAPSHSMVRWNLAAPVPVISTLSTLRFSLVATAWRSSTVCAADIVLIAFVVKSSWLLCVGVVFGVSAM